MHNMHIHICVLHICVHSLNPYPVINSAGNEAGVRPKRLQTRTREAGNHSSSPLKAMPPRESGAQLRRRAPCLWTGRPPRARYMWRPLWPMSRRPCLPLPAALATAQTS